MKYQKKLEAIAREQGIRAIVAQDALDAENAESYLSDVLQHGCQSGIVSDLIYYTDTKKFFIDNMEEIEELLSETEDSIGETLEKSYPLYNWMAWFGYEETARKIAEEISIEA